MNNTLITAEMRTRLNLHGCGQALHTIESLNNRYEALKGQTASYEAVLQAIASGDETIDAQEFARQALQLMTPVDTGEVTNHG